MSKCKANAPLGLLAINHYVRIRRSRVIVRTITYLISYPSLSFSDKSLRPNSPELKTFCFEAHQQCCSSKKKYNHDKNFCEFYAFDEPEINDNVEISEGIAFDAEDSTEGGIDCTMCQDEKCDADEAALDVIKE